MSIQTMQQAEEDLARDRVPVEVRSTAVPTTETLADT